MTARTPTFLKTRFEQGDIPQGTDYEDLIDSYVNVATTATQTITGDIIIAGKLDADVVSASAVTVKNLQVTNLNGSEVAVSAVSAVNINATDVSAVNLTLNNLTVDSTAVDTSALKLLSGENTGNQNLFQNVAVSGQATVSANTSADTLTLVEGPNVTITTDASAKTVTIDAATSAAQQNLFENVAVSGQTTVSAASPTDTLTFVEGDNVTITTNASAQEVTFAATSQGVLTVNPGSDTSGARSPYNTASTGGTGEALFSFRLPSDYNGIVSAVIQGIAGATGLLLDIDVTLGFTGAGEAYNANSNADTTSTYNTTVDEFLSIDISSLFTGVSGSDDVGVSVDHNGIGQTIFYTALQIVYNKS